MADPTPLEPPNQTTQCEQQMLLFKQPPPSGFTPNWVRVFVTTLVFILGYLAGPTVLLSWRIKERAACSIWDADERQRSMRGSVLLYLLFYIPIFLFRSQIAQLWTFIFSHLSLWLHLPLSAWVGLASIWPPTISTTLYRWLLALPLAYLLAYILQLIDELVGKTRREPVRVLLPEELAQLSSTGTKQKSETNRPHRSPSPSMSLWEQVDWNQVPNSDPLKQTVIEAMEQNALERYTQRVNAEI